MQWTITRADTHWATSGARLVVAAMAIAVATTTIACERKGPAERAGEKIDKAAQHVRDTVDPPKGPAEKFGRKVDRAVDND
jgi:hypothetical protein